MSPLTSFIMAADIVKFRVLQEGAFISSTADSKVKFLNCPQISLPLLVLLYQSRDKELTKSPRYCKHTLNVVMLHVEEHYKTIRQKKVDLKGYLPVSPTYP